MFTIIVMWMPMRILVLCHVLNGISARIYTKNHVDYCRSGNRTFFLVYCFDVALRRGKKVCASVSPFAKHIQWHYFWWIFTHSIRIYFSVSALVGFGLIKISWEKNPSRMLFSLEIWESNIMQYAHKWLDIINKTVILYRNERLAKRQFCRISNLSISYV